MREEEFAPQTAALHDVRPAGNRTLQAGLWSWDTVKTPPEQGAKEKPQTQAAGTGQAQINLSSFKDVREAKRNLDLWNRKMKEHINLQRRESLLTPRWDPEFVFLWGERKERFQHSCRRK